MREREEKSLRRNGVVLEARVWQEDRAYLRAMNISAGQALRSFVAAHRGDADVQELASKEERAREQAAALRAALQVARVNAATAASKVATSGTVEGTRREAVESLAFDFAKFGRDRFGLRENLNWIAGRTAASYPNLMKEDPRTLLAEVHDIATKGGV